MVSGHDLSTNYTDDTTAYLDNGVRLYVSNMTEKEELIALTNNIVYYCLMFPVALVGNLFTLTAVIMVLKIKRNIPNLLIGVLACNDLACLLICHMVTMVSMARREYVGNVMVCYLQSMWAYTYFKLGFFTKCLISLDRYIALAHPLKYRTLVTFPKTIVCIIVNVVFSIGTSALTLFIDPQYVNVLPTWYMCINNWKYYTWYKLTIVSVEGAIFFIGCVLFFISNITVIKVMVDMNKRTKVMLTVGGFAPNTLPQDDTNNNPMNRASKRGKKPSITVTDYDEPDPHRRTSVISPPSVESSPTKKVWHKAYQKVNVNVKRETKKHTKLQKELQFARLVAVIVTVFVVLWIPYMAVIYWNHHNRSLVPPLLEDIVIKLVFANACFNPIIYGVFNANFRRAYAYYLKMMAFVITCKLTKRPVDKLNKNMSMRNLFEKGKYATKFVKALQENSQPQTVSDEHNRLNYHSNKSNVSSTSQSTKRRAKLKPLPAKQINKLFEQFCKEHEATATTEIDVDVLKMALHQLYSVDAKYIKIDVD